MTGFGGVFLAFALFGVAAASPSGALPAEVSAKLEALQKKATSLYQNGFYREALQASQEALKQTIEEFGPDHEQTGIQAFGVGYAAEAAGDLAEAERRYADSVRIREKVYGQDSAGVATALERLARVILDEGRPAEAEALFLRELKIWRDTVGEHAIAADAYAGLGAVNAMRGDYAAALSYYRKAVERLASQTAAQATAKSVIEADIKRHRDVFIGLARAAAGVMAAAGRGSSRADGRNIRGGPARLGDLGRVRAREDDGAAEGGRNRAWPLHPPPRNAERPHPRLE